jgi:hypothetical protein
MQKYLANNLEDILIYACSYVGGAIIGQVILGVLARTLGFQF